MGRSVISRENSWMKFAKEFVRGEFDVFVVLLGWRKREGEGEE